MHIVVCDAGLGNLRSVERALVEAARGRDDRIEVSSDPSQLAKADKLVMPGQGGFRDGAQALSGPLGDAVRQHIATERPYLGICLGLQLLFATSQEAPQCTGLGLLEGEVVRLPDGVDAMTGAALKIPHMGWNVAQRKDTAGALRLLPRSEHFYFTHSFAVAPRDPRVVAAITEYGSGFVSAVAFDNIFACQFHPEKSQRAGLDFLGRFLAS